MKYHFTAPLNFHPAPPSGQNLSNTSVCDQITCWLVLKIIYTLPQHVFFCNFSLPVCYIKHTVLLTCVLFKLSVAFRLAADVSMQLTVKHRSVPDYSLTQMTGLLLHFPDIKTGKSTVTKKEERIQKVSP